jgi:hypothetical protein
VHGVDLEVAPVERAVGVVVVDLALAARILGALHGECDAAGRSKFVAGVLLVGGETAARLVGADFAGDLGLPSGGEHERELKADEERRAQTDRVLRCQHDDGGAGDRHQDQDELDAAPLGAPPGACH